MGVPDDAQEDEHDGEAAAHGLEHRCVLATAPRDEVVDGGERNMHSTDGHNHFVDQWHVRPPVVTQKHAEGVDGLGDIQYTPKHREDEQHDPHDEVGRSYDEAVVELLAAQVHVVEPRGEDIEGTQQEHTDTP